MSVMLTDTKPNGTVFTAGLWMAVELCCRCGVKFAIPYEMQNRLKQTKECFYCPNGHGQNYTGKTEAEKLRDQLAIEQTRHAQTRAEYACVRQERDDRSRQLSATKGVVTRIKNRVGKGICPCCNRTFLNLQRHMQGQHPDYAHSKEREATDGEK